MSKSKSIIFKIQIHVHIHLKFWIQIQSKSKLNGLDLDLDWNNPNPPVSQLQCSLAFLGIAIATPALQLRCPKIYKFSKIWNFCPKNLSSQKEQTLILWEFFSWSFHLKKNNLCFPLISEGFTIATPASLLQYPKMLAGIAIATPASQLRRRPDYS